MDQAVSTGFAAFIIPTAHPHIVACVLGVGQKGKCDVAGGGGRSQGLPRLRMRKIPKIQRLGEVKEGELEEQEVQRAMGLHSSSTVQSWVFRAPVSPLAEPQDWTVDCPFTVTPLPESLCWAEWGGL